MNKKIKIMMLVAIATLLSGCEKEAKETTSKYTLPEGLEDCKIFKLRNDDGGVIVVTRCPLSSTTTAYTSGKSTESSTVIDENPKKVPQ